MDAEEEVEEEEEDSVSSGLRAAEHWPIVDGQADLEDKLHN